MGMVTKMNPPGWAGERVMAMQDELSLCVEPRRGGCYVDEIDGKRVLQAHRASVGAPLHPASTRARSLPRSLALRLPPASCANVIS